MNPKYYLLDDPKNLRVFNEQRDLENYLENNYRKNNHLVAQKPTLMLVAEHLSASIVDNEVKISITNEHEIRDNKIP